MNTMNKPTIIKRGQAAKSVIIDTVNLANDAVCSTLGPGGSNVLIQTDQGSKITKDGVSCLLSIIPENPFERAVINVIKDACMKTNKNVGDGTSSTVALISDIVLNAVRRRDGLNGIQVRNGLMLAANEIVAKIESEEFSKPIADINTSEGENMLRQIANISANNDKELTEMIVSIFKECGAKANVKIELSNTAASEYKVVDGFKLDKGYLSAYFADDSGVITMDNPDIYVSEKTVANLPELTPIINMHSQMDKPFIIIAPKFELSVLNALVMYKMRGLKVCCVLLSEFGADLRSTFTDIAALTKATLISDQTGVSFRSSDITVPGAAKTVIIDERSTTIIDGYGDKDIVNNRIESIEAQVKKSYDPEYTQALKHRIDNLRGGIAILSIGGNTSARARERYDLADDAVNACHSAIKKGVLPGGGSMLLQCKQMFNTATGFAEFKKQLIDTYGFDSATYYGATLLFDACSIVSRHVITNALDVDSVYEIQNKLTTATSKTFAFKTYDLKTKQIVDAMKIGVIDPTDVIINQVLNAAEAAGTLLTMASIIVNTPKQADVADLISKLAD